MASRQDEMAYVWQDWPTYHSLEKRAQHV